MKDLDQLRDDFKAIHADVERLLFGIRDDQFQWHPGDGRWSIADCLTHLNLVDGMDADLLSTAVRYARAKGLTAVGPFRYSRLTTWLIRQLEPPPKLRTRAPKIYVPRPNQPLDKVRDEFFGIHNRLVGILEMAEGLDLLRIKVPAPFAAWLKFNFTQRMRLIAAHDRRHIWQAWQIPGTPGFPG